MTQKSFKELEKEYNELWMKGKVEEVLEKVKEAAKLYPEESYSTNLDLAAAHMHLGNLEETKQILEESLNQSILYPKMYFTPILDHEEFKDLFKRWEQLKERLQKDAQSDYLVIEPNNYNEKLDYPLFIALHGWGEDVKFFKEYWKSTTLSRDFILVLPQSSQVVGSKSYSWDDTELARKEVKNIYQKINASYKVDTNKVIVGGFSQGGSLAMDLTFGKDFVPVRGFISLCPHQKTEYLDRETINKANNDRIKGVILTGDLDQSLQVQKEIVEQFEALKFNYQFKITEGLGHWFPKDLGEQINQGIDFILK